ncbi:hypothetical protein CAS74_002483 [Pichia kudriavzevii]|uniref:Uncharacterized protein n=1 Tax=Pichia kudriavzevii TaxID=4909 RepID=A0A1Z8JQ53_PICKU|nr:hypothetical protein CAS74_002483 [Pichia kudriavzevii]
MDMDSEIQEFQKQHTPSLIGDSVRQSSDIPTVTSLNEKSARPLYMGTDSAVDLVPVEEIRAEGALVADEDDQLKDVLDESGHVVEAAIPDNIRLKSAEPDESKVTILGGDAGTFIAPASGKGSSHKYPTKQKKGSSESNDHGELIESENTRSVDDIINVVGKGDFEKASTLVGDKAAETLSSRIKELSIDDMKKASVSSISMSSHEQDPEYTAPAAMRDGSDSRCMSEARSSSSFSRPPISRYNSSSRPNLARGDSIHSGLNGENALTNTFDETSNSLVSERRPRHDPSNPRVSNQSSINYLRSISRSRSRVRNDRKALGEEVLDSNSLRASGALINDDEMSNAPDIDYAVKTALDFVEDTHATKGGNKPSGTGDIVRDLQQGLAEVAEEEDASNRTQVDDLLDQLANSAKELMIGEVSDKEDIEIGATKDEVPESRDESVHSNGLTKPGVQNDEQKDKLDDLMETLKSEIIDLPDNSGAIEQEKDSNSKETMTIESVEVDGQKLKEEEDLKREITAPDRLVDNIDALITEHNIASESPLEEGISLAEENAPKEGLLKPKENESMHNEGNIGEIGRSTETQVENAHCEEEGTQKDDDELEQAEKVMCNSKSLGEDSDFPESKKNLKNDEGTEENIIEEKDDDKGIESQNETPIEVDTSRTETDNFSQLPVPESSEDNQEENIVQINPADKSNEETNTHPDDEDDIDALIAAAAREKAMQDSHNNPMGADGSVYVPKAAKMTFEDEPVYLFTSFAGGFHVTTRTNRLVTILTANRIKFEYRDLGTDEEAKKVWRRYSGGKTLPGIVRGKDDYIGNWEDIEEANEDYRVRSMIYESY